MTDNKLQKANTIHDEISALERYIRILGEIQTNRGGTKDLKFGMSVTTTTKVTLFANRIYGYERIIADVLMPDSILLDLSLLSKKRLENLKKEYDSLFY